MKKIIPSLLLMGLMTASSYVTAKMIPMQMQPNATAKTVSQIDVSKGVVPIIYKNDWVKVGDPNTGHVGWIKKSALGDASVQIMTKGPQQQTVIREYSQKNQGPKVERVIIYSGTKKMEPQQMRAMIKEVQQQQQRMEQHMQRMMKMMIRDFASFQQFPQSNFDFDSDVPMVKPNTDPKESVQ